MDFIKYCIEFFKNYYAYIVLGLSVAAFILDVLILIKRNKAPLLTVYAKIREILPGIINKVEESKLQGSDKLSLATQSVITYLKKVYPDIKSDKYINVIHVMIEELLSTPQKKGE